MRWVGLDLHKHYITACALDDAGQVVAEHRRLPPDVDALVGWLVGLGDAVTVAMEATSYWAWLHDQLRAAGIAAVAAHPYQVKLIWQARCKTDPIDARKLAELLRTNLLPVIWVPDAEVRARRTLLRGRAYLVRVRTQLKHRIHGHLTAVDNRAFRGALEAAKRSGNGVLRAEGFPMPSRGTMILKRGRLNARSLRANR